MLDTNEFTKSVHGEVRSGVVRRRRWSGAEKGRIVAEAVAPGAIKAAKDGRLCHPAHGEIAFVPVVAGGLTDGRTAAAAGKPVEVVIGSVVVRVPSGADARTA